jgi:SAM-dependent methyltransferase
MITCIDIRPSLVLTGKLPTNISFAVQDLKKLNITGTFDFIHCINVLEHIRENPQVVECFHAALKQGGYLYLHVPNKSESYILPLRFFPAFSAWAEEEHVGEMYTLEGLKNMVSGKGFAVQVVLYAFGFTGQLLWELDRITGNARVIKILLMPLLKLQSHIAVKIPTNHSYLLILARE